MTRSWGEDLSGKSFGRLTALHEADRENGLRMWCCACSCGAVKIIGHRGLKSGKTKSCGCLRSDLMKEKATHGQARKGKQTKAYKIWSGMIARCTIPSATGYERYGGAGVAVCDSWRDFGVFLADMGDPPLGMSIDRIDGSKGYEPGNCRWATRQEQNENRSSVRWIDHDGKRMTVAQWARHLGLSKATLYEALDKYPVEHALRARSGSIPRPTL